MSLMTICPQKGDETESLEQTKLPEGWEWADDWQIDLNRAVDEEGRSFRTEVQFYMGSEIFVVVTGMVSSSSSSSIP